MLRAVRLATGAFCAAIALLYPSLAVAQGAPNLKVWYFAEGSTAPGLPFEEEILVGNPNPTPANITIRYLRDDGSPPIVKAYGVPAYSRQGFNVHGEVGDLTGVAVEVTSDVDIVAERSMYWGGGRFNFPVQFPGRAILDMRAGHSSRGVNETRTTWSFAEGSAGYFQTYVLVSNPGTAPADVRVKYLTSQGEEITDFSSVAPGARWTFSANAALASLGRPQVDFAIEVVSENGVGVVAERAMYWNNFGGGHAAVGVVPQATWLFAEGVQAPGVLDTYVLLFNPNPVAVTVAVDFLGQDGLLQPVVVTIDPRRRAQVYAGEYAGLLNQSFAIAVNAAGNQPIVAERAVYRVYGATLGDGTVASGLPAPAFKWGFAEGQEGGFQQFQNPLDADKRLFSTYYQVLNNSDVPVTVRGVFYAEPSPGVAAGSGVELTKLVNPRSRETFAPSLLPDLHNRKFAAFFEASAPVVMERATYWGVGFKGAHATGGTPLPDALPALASPTAMPAPTLTGISPNRGTPSGGTPVTITGTGLGLAVSGAGSTTVAFGVTPVNPATNPITVIDANTISLRTPASGRGVSSVQVTTRGVALELVGAFEFADPNAALGAPISIGDEYGLVSTVAAQRFGDLLNSCTEHSGGNNNFMFEVVAALRQKYQTNRWGLNWKRGNRGDLSQDIVNYYNGPEGGIMRDSTSVRIYDIIGGHCGGRPGPFWVDQTGATRAAGAIGRWTSDPMCRSARYRDAKFNNGEWMFPECR